MTCALLRRSMAFEIGPCDDRFIQYDCDLAFSRHAVARGWYAWYTPELAITHIGGVSFSAADKKAYEYDARRRYFRVFHGRLAELAVVVGLRAVGLAKAVARRSRARR